MTLRTIILAGLCCAMAAWAQVAAAPSKVIEGIEFSGMMRVPQDTVKALIHSKVGDVYDEKALRSDFTALWNTGRFDDIQLKTEAGPRGGTIVRFVLTERADPALASKVIEGIEFRGVVRVPEETLRAAISSKAGDVYDEETMRRNFNALWNTGRFDDIRLNTEAGTRGGIIVRFVVTERP
jgi:outer membrane protein assembly factor BamA